MPYPSPIVEKNQPRNTRIQEPNLANRKSHLLNEAADNTEMAAEVPTNRQICIN